jgi:pantetheine-phosphate adenylyltransferase
MDPFKHFENILKLYISDRALKALPVCWTEPHRYYHNVDHLIQILKDIESDVRFNGLDVHEKHALLLAAFFHDIIYNPKKNDNEVQSIKYFTYSFTGSSVNLLKSVYRLIHATKYRKRPIDKLEQIFWDADNKLLKTGYDNLLKVDKLLRKEYSHLSDKQFAEGKIKFLESNLGLFNSSTDKDFMKLIYYYKKQL